MNRNNVNKKELFVFIDILIIILGEMVVSIHSISVDNNVYFFTIFMFILFILLIFDIIMIYFSFAGIDKNKHKLFYKIDNYKFNLRTKYIIIIIAILLMIIIFYLSTL